MPVQKAQKIVILIHFGIDPRCKIIIYIFLYISIINFLIKVIICIEILTIKYKVNHFSFNYDQVCYFMFPIVF